MADYLQAQARVDEAKRQLDHTVIYAPFSGIVTQVETVQPGMYLAAATAAFGLVSTENVWVEANPKETELTYVKAGRSGGRDRGYLSWPDLEGRSRSDRAQQRVGVFGAAGAKHIRQLGQGGAAHPGAHQGRAQGRRSGIALWHERRSPTSTRGITVAGATCSDVTASLPDVIDAAISSERSPGCGTRLLHSLAVNPPAPRRNPR